MLITLINTWLRRQLRSILEWEVIIIRNFSPLVTSLIVHPSFSMLLLVHDFSLVHWPVAPTVIYRGQFMILVISMESNLFLLGICYYLNDFLSKWIYFCCRKRLFGDGWDHEW